MKTKDYRLIEAYMLSCMRDSAHDREHIYRVLYAALDIASFEEPVDSDVLIAACLLHDIGRREQFENPALCHAAVGAEKALAFLVQNGFPPTFAEKVASCIERHRFRSDRPPVTPEEKILFDADKLDVTGAIGLARTGWGTLVFLDGGGGSIRRLQRYAALFFSRIQAETRRPVRSVLYAQRGGARVAAAAGGGFLL